jgi:hypothetical protein
MCESSSVDFLSIGWLAQTVGKEWIAGHRSPNSLILRTDRASTVDYNFQNICTTTNKAGMFSAVSLVSCDVQCSIPRGITNIFCSPLPNWSPNLVTNLPVFPNLLATHQFYQHRLTQTHSWVVVGRFSVKWLAHSLGWERIAGHRSPNSRMLRVDRASTVDYNFQNIWYDYQQSWNAQCSITRELWCSMQYQAWHCQHFRNPLPT